jgi:hypothetical protein
MRSSMANGPSRPVQPFAYRATLEPQIGSGSISKRVTLWNWRKTRWVKRLQAEIQVLTSELTSLYR